MGFHRLRAEFGEIIRDRRKSGYGTQAAVAEQAGIARETLSRIEKGHRPAYASTFDQIFMVLDLDWGDIADTGRSERLPRVFNGSFRDDAIHELGRALRAERRARGMSLRQLADRCSVSPGQLSRIERGEASRSRAIGDHPDDRHLDPEDRRLVFTDPFLAGLIARAAE